MVHSSQSTMHMKHEHHENGSNWIKLQYRCGRIPHPKSFRISNELSPVFSVYCKLDFSVFVYDENNGKRMDKVPEIRCYLHWGKCKMRNAIGLMVNGEWPMANIFDVFITVILEHFQIEMLNNSHAVHYNHWMLWMLWMKVFSRRWSTIAIHF